jgi:hypothetical protein
VIPPQRHHAITLAASMLAEILDSPPEAIVTQPIDPSGLATAEVGSHGFVLTYRQSGRAAAVAAAIDQLRAAAPAATGHPIPLLVVPHMGDVGRKLCSEANVAWLDLSGNAHMVAEGLRIHIEGRPNRYKARGRPSSVFAPKSSRIARWLLMNPHDWFTQSTIASSTAMDPGFTSRILARLVEDDLVERNEDGAYRPRDPELLLDAWHEDYDFHKHRVLRGHVAARSGDELLRKVSQRLQGAGEAFAVTGLAGAWLLDHHAGFRITTFYVENPLGEGLLGDIGFRAEPRGANTWIVVPNDPEVLRNSRMVDEGGVRMPCAHPVQVYLDLKGHPERSKEAAGSLRERMLREWVRSDG